MRGPLRAMCHDGWLDRQSRQTKLNILDQIGECLNYIAFMDEKDSAFVAREFGGDPEIITSVAMVQSILSDLYDTIEERVG